MSALRVGRRPVACLRQQPILAGGLAVPTVRKEPQRAGRALVNLVGCLATENVGCAP